MTTKRDLVTGTSAGLGRAIAVARGREGYDLALTELDAAIRRGIGYGSHSAGRRRADRSLSYAAADLPIAALTRGMTCSAMSWIERLAIAGSAQSIPA